MYCFQKKSNMVFKENLNYKTKNNSSILYMKTKIFINVIKLYKKYIKKLEKSQILY
jgi:hypothetical protein